MTDLTKSIRERADKAGISIRELHKRAGVAGNALWRWENVVAKPRAGLIEKFDAVLNQVEMEKKS